MRVLFLDFDGVFHPFGPMAGTGYNGPRAVHYTGVFCWTQPLIDLLKDHRDVVLVVHSSWRDAYSEAELGDMLEELGNPFGGVTPRGERAQSIQDWLAAHPEVTSYRILDDQARKFPKCLKPYLIACPRLKGLSAKPVQRALVAWLEQTAPVRQ